MMIQLFIYLALIGTTDCYGSGPLGQTDAMLKARDVVREASDASLQRSTVSGMSTIVALGAPGYSTAIESAVDAYGKYRNSQTLDMVGDINLLQSIKMESSIEKMAHRFSQYERTKTTYRRLNPSFLYTGEAGKVAEEFESATGMDREDFLTVMANASEEELHTDDPELIPKITERFEGFVAAIPNEDFRERVQEKMKTLSWVTRSEWIMNGIAAATEAVESFDNLASRYVGDEEANEKVVDKNEKLKEKTTETVASGKTMQFVDEVKSEKKFVKKGDFFDVDLLAYDGRNVATALLQQTMNYQNKSLFQMVSRRYSLLIQAGFGKLQKQTKGIPHEQRN